jgi:N6-L-threonylcarbamoyladenine synthase
LRFPSLGLVISGGNTVLVKINKIGSYETLATTTDDALGEALDKAARMLGLGYPGGAVLEKIAQLGNPNKFLLPIPLAGQETRQIFSYSGLKTSFYRLIESNKSKDPRFPTKQDIYDLAATFQNIAFTHLTRTISYIIKNSKTRYNDLLVGGGVSANNEIRNRLRRIAKENDIQIHFPYTKKLCGDNAAMIGVTAYLHATAGDFSKDTEIIDRNPNLKLSDIVLK